MRKILLVALAATGPALAGDYVPDIPKDSKEYEPTKLTQRLSQRRGVGGGPFFRYTEPVKIADMLNTDWHQSGGVHGIEGVTSKKYKNKEAVSKYATIVVTNEYGFQQPEMGIVRTYPDGTQFDDVLSYNGKVFEHRVRQKAGGVWSNTTAYREPANYPPGYKGLKTTCASCHNKAGTGAYGADGLVPGGDTVFSDPLDWTVIPRGAIVGSP